MHLLALIPCNNQILRSYKSPHQLFLLFWWGCKLRGAQESTPVVTRLGQGPRGAMKVLSQQAPCQLDPGSSAGGAAAKAAPKLLLLEWNIRSVSSGFASKLRQGSKHSSCRTGCPYLAWLSKAGFLSVPFPEFSFPSPFSTPYHFPEPCPWHLLSDVRYLNLELYFL